MLFKEPEPCLKNKYIEVDHGIKSQFQLINILAYDFQRLTFIFWGHMFIPILFRCIFKNLKLNNIIVFPGQCLHAG